MRALAANLPATVLASYVRVVIRHLRQSGQINLGTTHCGIGRNLRPSSPCIAEAVRAGLHQECLQLNLADCLPPIALALRTMQTGFPSNIGTGSSPISQNETDGLRINLADASNMHLCPSGNAPVLRCYTEATA